MLAHDPNRAAALPSQTDKQPLTVCIVDPHESDYAEWKSLVATGELRLQSVANANEALRCARTGAVDLWVVNVSLPGLSGYELCRMIKATSSSAVVYLIAEQYSPESEQAAWQARATLFGCKGGHHDWLSAWLQRKSTRSTTPPLQAIARHRQTF